MTDSLSSWEPIPGTFLTTALPTSPRTSAYFGAPIAEFLALSDTQILGHLVMAARDVEHAQRVAWTTTMLVLREALSDIDGHLFLEFDVPRLGSRIDAVVITQGIIFPIEFKAGESEFHRHDVHQAWDYGLDLKNFHSASHEAPILPVLVATSAVKSDDTWQPRHPDGVRPPLCTNATQLGRVIRLGCVLERSAPIDAVEWARAPYHPTPTIVQAAQALYAQHSVEAIARSEAGENLTVTSKRVEEVIELARTKRQKAIVFVTGVPGAGKTLVGLNVATQRSEPDSPTHAVFLSGNGPLVAVLREALIRDEVGRRRAQGEAKVRKGAVEQKVKPFIQNVHHFRDEGLRDELLPPHDHVVIFDEAQRAWDKRKTSDFMKRKKGRPGFDQSEPEFLISYMDRHTDWAVVICLVGGGQEIHDGEAGIGAWLEAVQSRFAHWSVYISEQLTAAEYAALETVRSLQQQTAVSLEPALHLSVSMRSFRAERVSDFVKAVLDCEIDPARVLFQQIAKQYPLVITRDLDRAKAWIRSNARGTERYGLVASSQAMRLKPHAIDIRVNVDPIHYFLNDPTDTRSSWYLEDAATEFQIQGLELDWTCVNWDADLRYTNKSWSHHQFRGAKWENINSESRRRYMLNAYRVLLTRARQGMVIFVPPGNSADPTRRPAFYDGTYRYLRELGLQQV